MKILKTKQEKTEIAKQKAEKVVSEITAKVEQYNSIKVVFDREDFKKELNDPRGFSDKDMKKQYRVALEKLQKIYKVKVEPDLSEGMSNFKVIATISKKKSED